MMPMPTTHRQQWYNAEKKQLMVMLLWLLTPAMAMVSQGSVS